MNSPDPVTRLNSALQGRYAIERELGEGGMATVYLADDLKHERKVALKVLEPELTVHSGRGPGVVVDRNSARIALDFFQQVLRHRPQEVSGSHQERSVMTVAGDSHLSKGQRASVV